jgi:Flp pilus assembly protein TadD
VRLLAAALAGALALAGIAVVALRSRTARSRSVSSNPAVEELLARSRFLRNHKRFAESKQFVEEALRLDPKNPNALAGLSLNVLADGRQDEARELALRAIELDPNAWEAYRTLGNYARMAGDMNGAERHLRRAVDANPRDFKGRNRLARLLLELGKLEEARGQMLESKRLAPDDADVQDIWIGYSLRTGDYEEAIRLGKIWFTMWEKHPEGLMSPVLRDQVALANVGARRYEEAQALFKSIDPQDDLRVALTLGFAGRAAEARTMLAAREARSAASGSPLDPQTAGALAMASIAVGDFDRAFGHLDRQVSAGAFPGWLNCALFDPIRRHPRWPAFQERLDREFFRGKERKAPFPRPDEGWPRPKERGTAS